MLFACLGQNHKSGSGRWSHLRGWSHTHSELHSLWLLQVHYSVQAQGKMERICVCFKQGAAVKKQQSYSQNVSSNLLRFNSTLPRFKQQLNKLRYTPFKQMITEGQMQSNSRCFLQISCGWPGSISSFCFSSSCSPKQVPAPALDCLSCLPGFCLSLPLFPINSFQNSDARYIWWVPYNKVARTWKGKGTASASTPDGYNTQYAKWCFFGKHSKKPNFQIYS